MNIFSPILLGIFCIGMIHPALAQTADQDIEQNTSNPPHPVLTEAEAKESLSFPLGKATRPNLMTRSAENPEMGVALGIRFQGTALLNQPTGEVPSNFDFFGRRVRFEISTFFSKNQSFVMDIRNDNAGREDSGERTFNVGDAYFVSKKLFGSSALNLKAYRGKVDVSRSQTAKSSWQIYYDRAEVSDFAANYVSHNRRAANVQLFGDFDDKVAYSFAIGDGIQSGSFRDAKDESADEIIRQNPMFGGKIILSPFTDWEEKERTETYFGQGQHFSVGAGYFRTGNIQFTANGTSGTQRVDRGLLNLETSAHYKSLFVQAEYFRFSDTVEDFGATTLNKGNSNGWYVVSEYVLPQAGYLAPFVRYERWNRFEGEPGYQQISRVAGINWYLRGNTIRVGAAVQDDNYGNAIGSDSGVTYKLLSQLHF